MENETLLDIIRDKFSKSKIKLIKDLDEHLIEFDLADEYKEEIENKFCSKVKLIFDLEKEGNFVNFYNKVYGKSNLAFFVFGINGLKGGELKLLIYLNGTLSLNNNYLDFSKIDLFTYGSFGDEDYCFTSFKSSNSKLLIKVEDDYVYGILVYDENEKYAFKMEKNFYKNPVIETSEDIYDPDDKINEKTIVNLFNSNEGIISHLKDLKIYQIEN